MVEASRQPLRRLAADGRSVVVALHDLTLARRFCERMVLLKDGVARASGPPSEVLTAATLAEVFGIRAVIGEIDGVPVVVAGDALRDPNSALCVPRDTGSPRGS